MSINDTLGYSIEIDNNVGGMESYADSDGVKFTMNYKTAIALQSLLTKAIEEAQK